MSSKIALLRQQLIELDTKLGLRFNYREYSTEQSSNDSPHKIETVVKEVRKEKKKRIKRKHKVRHSNSLIEKHKKLLMCRKHWTSVSPHSIKRRCTESKEKADKLEIDLQLEKQKNKRLKQQIEECEKNLSLNAKMRDKVKNFKEEYEVLVKSFKYSEQIRKKQQNIIRVLTSQIAKAQ